MGASKAELLTNFTRLLSYDTSLCYVDSNMTPGVVDDLRAVSMSPYSSYLLYRYLQPTQRKERGLWRDKVREVRVGQPALKRTTAIMWSKVEGLYLRCM
jgi:hypothetical protein